VTVYLKLTNRSGCNSCSEVILFRDIDDLKEISPLLHLPVQQSVTQDYSRFLWNLDPRAGRGCWVSPRQVFKSLHDLVTEKLENFSYESTPLYGHFYQFSLISVGSARRFDFSC
jgi:hypothetical protein